MHTRELEEKTQKLIAKFEKNCEKQIEKIEQFRTEELHSIKIELNKLKSKLFIIGFIFVIINIMTQVFPAIIVITILATIYFYKKSHLFKNTQDKIKTKLENLTLDYISLLHTPITKKRTVKYETEAKNVIKKIISLKGWEDICFENIFFGTYKETNFEIYEASVIDASAKDDALKFYGTIYKIIHKRNYQAQTLKELLTDNAYFTANTFDNEGNLIISSRFKTINSTKINIQKRIIVPIHYLEDILEHISNICKVIDIMQESNTSSTKDEALELKQKITQKIKEIKLPETKPQSKTNIKPIKKEIIEIPKISIEKTEQPETKEIITKEIKEQPEQEIVADDTIDLMDIMEL